MTAEIEQHDPQLNNEPSVRLVQVYRSLLRIVARLESASYTESYERQTVGLQSDDPADPASDETTAQG